MLESLIVQMHLFSRWVTLRMCFRYALIMINGPLSREFLTVKLSGRGNYSEWEISILKR